MSSEPLSDDDIKEYLNNKGVTISPSARNMLGELENPDPALELLAKEYKSRVMVTESDIHDILSRVDTSLSAKDNTDNTTETDGDESSDTTDEDSADPETSADGEDTEDSTDDDDSTSEDSDEDENEDEPTPKERLGYRPQVRNHTVEKVTEDTAKDVHEFDQSNPNLDDPFEAIERFDESEWPDRPTESRDIDIEEDISGQSKSNGEIDDFAAYFRSRYEKLAEILKDRVTPRAIDSLTQDKHPGQYETIAVIGMVNDMFDTRSDNKLLVLEDTTGATMRVVFTDEEQKLKCDEVVNDEVIAVEGTLSEDAGIIFGDDLHFPEVPPRNRQNTADRSVKAALVSDIHFGAREFAVDKWNEFVQWIGHQEDIEYLLVAGDIIEGVGIYAGQQEELAVPNLERQYELCALAFDQLPSDMDIIVTPGNHDGIRLAEPQPAFPPEVRDLFGDNVHWGGNPSTITLEGVKFLLYHGVSLNPIIDALPDGDIQHPVSAMEPMIRKRHVAPLYGEGVRIAPEHEDHLVIEEIPDVFHTGHVHTFDIGDYRNITLVNTGTWQHQTKYQIDLDVNPDVGYCTVVDLGDHSVENYAF